MKQKRELTEGEFNMCRRKRRYTPRRAYRTLGKFSQNGSEPHIYRCPFCGCRHLGKTLERRKEKFLQSEF